MGIVLDYESRKPKQKRPWWPDVALGVTLLLVIVVNFCAMFDVISLMKGYSLHEACRDYNVFALFGFGWFLAVPAVVVAKLAGFNAHWISVGVSVLIATGGFVANFHFVALITASC